MTNDILLTKPERAGKPPWGATLTEPRLGVMLHYDASGSDKGALQWLLVDPTCKVSYNWLVLDNGAVRDIAPNDCVAYHAGVCRSSDPTRLPYKSANAAFYGVAAAAKPGDVITPAQHLGIVLVVAACFQKHGWSADDLWRIVDHKSEATYPKGHAKAGQRGRKVDIDGVQGMTVQSVREAVRAYLTAGVR